MSKVVKYHHNYKIVWHFLEMTGYQYLVCIFAIFIAPIFNYRNQQPNRISPINFSVHSNTVLSLYNIPGENTTAKHGQFNQTVLFLLPAVTFAFSSSSSSSSWILVVRLVGPSSSFGRRQLSSISLLGNCNFWWS